MKKKIRQNIWDMLEGKSKAGSYYDVFMMFIIILSLILGYVLIVALVMFNMEYDTFNNFLHAIYWVTTSLTKIGYGDVFPQSFLGQVFTIISAFVGVVVIALPTGIIAGGFIDEIHKPIEEEHGSGKPVNEETSKTNELESTDPINQMAENQP